MIISFTTAFIVLSPKVATTSQGRHHFTRSVADNLSRLGAATPCLDKHIIV
ncbi:hypothetical protein ACERC9_00180 [Moraxella sp. E6BC]|uniref:hypothetical protein n=1 Tax=Moraxella sp. E33BD TaxID=3278713 RepID=UPI00359D4F3A